MVTVGLIGGIASGKSLVANEFERLGAVVLDGDQAGHEVLTQVPVIDKLVERWGRGILLSDATINRREVAKIVFQKNEKESSVAHDIRDSENEDPVNDTDSELAYLESVTHPAIGELLRQQIAKHQEAGQDIIVLDAAVMLKAGWNKMCDRIIFVDVPREIREQRAIQRGMSATQFASRELAQTPVEEKKRLADYVIDNSGPKQKTYKQVEQVWHLLAEMA